MSPKRTNGKASPVKFSAGGSKKSSSSNKKQADSLAGHMSSKNNNEVASTISDDDTRKRSSNSSEKGTTTSNKKQVVAAPTNNIQWITSGLQKKQSPLTLEHWIATVLTLDGRDKFTKVLQYSCRLLGWYFAGLAVRSKRSELSTENGGNNIIASSVFYQALSTRFTSLYKSFVTSRKAFRMGRSIIEWDKIRSMGWGEYLGYFIRHPLEEGGVRSRVGRDSLLGRLDTHPIPEEEEDEERDDDEKSWIGEEASAAVEEKKDDTPATEDKVVSRPGRPILPSRMSSNIGWGPSTTTATEEDTSETYHRPPPPRTVSEMGRQMYRPYPSQSSTSFGSYQQLKETSTLATQTPPSTTTPSTTTPAWELIGGTLKLFGLMGFWAFDNISFLTSSGFLDPITTNTTHDAKTTTTIRTKRKQRASEYAARCYFMGGLAGLYVNLRSFWIHGNGPLMEARRRYESGRYDDKGDDEGNAQSALKKTEQKHFTLFLALLKSICDVTVFSNNPGIDLHLKLRGKKNHEGLHCLCGLISAGTVLYNNFPNAK